MAKFTVLCVFVLFVGAALCGEEPTVSPTPSISFTPSVSPSQFSQPLVSPAITPFVSQGSTANLILQLDIAIQARHVETNPLEAELETVIATFMGISTSDIIVVSASVNEQASVLICAGDIATFANALNAGDPFFDGTVLEGAYVENIFWAVQCQDPLSNLPSNSYWGGDDDDNKSSYWTRSDLFYTSGSGDSDTNSAGRMVVTLALLLALVLVSIF